MVIRIILDMIKKLRTLGSKNVFKILFIFLLVKLTLDWYHLTGGDEKYWYIDGDSGRGIPSVVRINFSLKSQNLIEISRDKDSLNKISKGYIMNNYSSSTQIFLLPFLLKFGNNKWCYFRSLNDKEFTIKAINDTYDIGVVKGTLISKPDTVVFLNNLIIRDAEEFEDLSL